MAKTRRTRKRRFALGFGEGMVTSDGDSLGLRAQMLRSL